MSTAIIVFICTYTLILLGIIQRTAAAFLGAAAMLAIGAIKPMEAFKAIDFDTVGLLVGMMIIVGITRKTGIFEFLAIKAAQKAKGEPINILAALCLLTAIFSAFLDNVTMVMLIIPIVFAIARQLKINPVPFLIAIILASNIGGAATLVGDPPNVMIGGFTGLGFMNFIINLAPVITVIYIVSIHIVKIIFKNQMVTSPALKKRVMKLNAANELYDNVLLYKCVIVIFFTVMGFILHQQTRIEPASVAIIGAGFLILITRNGFLKSLKYVEWSVILFFVSLFIMIGALDKIGVFEIGARRCLDITDGNILSAALIILWLSAVSSAFVDNIPFVAAMIPLIQDMGRLGGIHDLTFLWWSLSLGACLGGNGTAIGASANVVVIGMAEKRGVHISFLYYMKLAYPLMLLSIAISTLYLLLWYYCNVLK